MTMLLFLSCGRNLKQQMMMQVMMRACYVSFMVFLLVQCFAFIFCVVDVEIDFCLTRFILLWIAMPYFS